MPYVFLFKFEIILVLKNPPYYSNFLFSNRPSEGTFFVKMDDPLGCFIVKYDLFGAIPFSIRLGLAESFLNEGFCGLVVYIFSLSQELFTHLSNSRRLFRLRLYSEWNTTVESILINPIVVK